MNILDSLTGLRFAAAMLVLLRHAVPPLFPLPGLLELSLVGPVGVGFFFVLSGFILTWTWKPDRSIKTFYVGRIARIAPLHLLTTVVAFIFLIAASTPFWLSSILSLLLLQGWGTDALRLGGNPPSWSLSVEAFFYLTFPFIVRLISGSTIRRCLLVAFVAVTAMVLWTGLYAVASLANVPFITAFSTYTNPLYRLGEFIIGICLATAIRSGWSLGIRLSSATIFAALGYVLLALLNWGMVRSGLRLGDTLGLPLGVLDLIYLPFTVLLIAAAATADIGSHPSPFRGRWMVRLGKWSFALYLVQAIVISQVARFAQPAVSTFGLALLMGTIAACVALSALMHKFVETPAELALKRRFDSSGRNSIPALR